MEKKDNSKQQLFEKIEELRIRLKEAEETLSAIRGGEVDAIVVSGLQGEQVFTLTGAERVYRVLIETMNEGAASLNREGIIIYCNQRLSEMVKTPLEKVIGAPMRQFIRAADLPVFDGLLKKGSKECGKGEVVFKHNDGTVLPVLLSISAIQRDNENMCSMIVTDLTAQKQIEEELRKHRDNLEELVKDRTSELETSNQQLQMEITKRKQTEDALRKSEEYFRALIEYGSDIITELDEHGTIIYESPSIERAFGYHQSDMQGKNVSEFVHPDDIAVVANTLLRGMVDLDTIYSSEFRFKHHDGTWRTMESLGKSFISPSGTLRAIVNSRDITERKQAEDRIRNLNRIYRILSNINHAIIHVREPKALFNEACRIAVEDGGFRMAWIGLVDEATRKVEPVAHAGVTDGYLDIIKITLNDEPRGRGPTAIALRTRKCVICNDIEHDPRMAIWLGDALRLGYRASIALPLYINGNKRGTFNLYAETPGFFDEEEAKLLDGLAMNISHAIVVADLEEQRKRSEEALLNSEMFVKNILASIDEAFVVVDRDYRILTANRAYCEQAEKPLADIAGKYCYEISHHMTRPCHELGQDCPCKRTLETGASAISLHTHTDKKGKQVHVEVKTFPMKNESGAVTSIIEIISDITEKRALEGQLQHAQKMEGIGTLAGGIAHDFNNILSAIIGYGHVTLMKMPKDDPQRLNIEHILESADRGATLTQSLLAFSRKQIIDRKHVDLNNILKKVEKFLVRVIGADVAVHLALAEGALSVFADAGQLEQVFMNLATNARDAMPSGGSFSIETSTIVLDSGFVAAHGFGKPGRYALVSATDTGAGMNEETRKKIFEPFFTTKEVGKGTGLGLAMVYGIIKQHEGFINVYSEPGKGTTFRIYLPLITAAAVEEQREIEAEYPKGGTETVLLAEDDASLRKLNVIILEQGGYTVITANDGEEAVAKFMENKDRIQLLLFDIIMPKKNGREAFEEIRKIKSDIPVLFASGYSPDMLRDKALIENGAATIFKPMSPQSLLKKVRDVLDGIR